MRKREKQNTGLPARWRYNHGAYYYMVPKGLEPLWDGKKQFRLGRDLPEAYQVWAERIGPRRTGSTVSKLLDEYLLRVVPHKAKATQITNQIQIAKLRQVLGNMMLPQVTAQIVHRYVDLRSQKKTDEKTGRVTGGRIAAHREVEILTHAFMKAVQWGWLDKHPFKGLVSLEGEKGRDRYVEDWEVVECLALAPRRKAGSVLAIQAYIRLKLLTGMAQTDLLRLQEGVHILPEGIRIKRSKTANSTGKVTVYKWTDELEDAVGIAREARPASSTFLFCNRRGEGYIKEHLARASGWKSMWQRFMSRVLKDTKVTEPFHEHDLRAKAASDAESLEHARALLSHADSRTTRRFYMRKPEVVTPNARRET